MQVYAPTSSHYNDELEAFYEEVEYVHDKGRNCHFMLIIGDLNSKVGIRKQEDVFVYCHGIDERN